MLDMKAQSGLLMCMCVCKLMGLGSPRQSSGMSCAAHQCAMKSSWCGFCLKIWAIMIAQACISMSYVLCGSFLSIDWWMCWWFGAGAWEKGYQEEHGVLPDHLSFRWGIDGRRFSPWLPAPVAFPKEVSVC